MPSMVSRGFTLTEMLIVVGIVGIVATAATASLATSDTAKLSAATAEVVNLVRFARSESIRTGKAHGVETNLGSQRLRVYARSGFFGFRAYTVRNPATKNLYTLDFDDAPGLSDVTLSGVDLIYEGGGNQAFLGFNPDGIPKYESGSTIHLLSNAEIRLSLGREERIVHIAPITGRVSVQ